MSGKEPGPAGGRARRSFTPAQKLEFLARYEQAVQDREGGAWLRREGLYSSSITQWRKERDAGLLQGRAPGESVGRPSAEQAEIARLKRALEVSERKRATSDAALEIVGKAFELLETISKSEEQAEAEQQIPPAFRRKDGRGRS
ncbi:hypothetical protein GCM10027456_68060 [Kineosporia babensis]